MLITTDGTDAELAIAAARAGAAVVRGMYGAELMRVEKSAGDFATTADLQAEKTIVEAIQAARPGDAITGEEAGRIGTGSTERMWLVDPLCGTLNYAARNMLVAVNVALRAGSGIIAAASPCTPQQADCYRSRPVNAHRAAEDDQRSVITGPDDARST